MHLQESKNAWTSSSETNTEPSSVSKETSTSHNSTSTALVQEQNTFFLISDFRAGTQINQRRLLKAGSLSLPTFSSTDNTNPGHYCYREQGSLTHITAALPAAEQATCKGLAHTCAQRLFSPQHRTTSSSLFEDVRMRPLENK